MHFKALSFSLALAGLAACASGAAFAAETSDLEAYVARLRADRAGPRRETGFLSAGADFLGGQDYFESRNYSAAAWSFADAVRKEPANAFFRYQLALALLRQNDSTKRREAQPHLDTAFRLNPELRERFRRDMPAAPAPTAAAPKPVPPVAPATAIAEPPAAPPINPSRPRDSASRQAGANSLQRYIDRLKAARAAGGPETAMNTLGRDALYAIEYYEARDYRAAESGLRLALAREPQHPQLNYLLAVALAAQGKDTGVARLLETAFRGAPDLREVHAADLAAAQAAWRKTKSDQVASSAPATPPTPQAAPGGPLVFGNYTCSVTVWNGPNTTPAFRSDYEGYFELKGDGTYRWLDDGETGRYRYNADTGQIDWLSGHLHGLARSSRFEKQGRSGLITIEFSDTYRWRCYREVK